MTNKTAISTLRTPLVDPESHISLEGACRIPGPFGGNSNYLKEEKNSYAMLDLLDISALMYSVEVEEMISDSSIAYAIRRLPLLGPGTAWIPGLLAVGGLQPLVE